MTGLKLKKQHVLCVYQATNKQTKEAEKEKRITCAEQDSMKVKRGIKMYYV
jgi:hypothetical protein